MVLSSLRSLFPDELFASNLLCTWIISPSLPVKKLLNLYFQLRISHAVRFYELCSARSFKFAKFGVPNPVTGSLYHSDKSAKKHLNTIQNNIECCSLPSHRSIPTRIRYFRRTLDFRASLQIDASTTSRATLGNIVENRLCGIGVLV